MRNSNIPENVRHALAAGNVRLANTLLNDIYSLRGIVIKGRQLGRALGYPTANLQLRQNEPLLLAYGIYAVKVNLDESTWNGMANIGIRPTLDHHELTIEVNIFDFDRDIYGQEIVIHFIERTRDEKKFNSLEELKDQMAKDKTEISELLTTGMHSDPHP
jgi:riboflavin kinase / FMN adenylyltransferase